VNDDGKPQNDITSQQDKQAHELIEQLNLLEAIDRRITPEHVAKRFRELLADIGDDDLPGPEADERPDRMLDQPGHGRQLAGLSPEDAAERRLDLAGLNGSMDAAIAVARSAAADIIADAQLKAKTSIDELRRAQEAAVAARLQAEQIVADARTEADNALERAVKLVQDAGEQAERIISKARNEAEQMKQPFGTDPVSAWPPGAPGLPMPDPRTSGQVIARLRYRMDSEDPLATLTAQEKRVLELIGEGLTNRQIAKRMFLSEKTVKNYVSSTLAKLGIQRRTQAATFAVRR
jgi:DNA-binding CsgD family transcriptional regulator/F0F1-type ATP synthase membrane subunit b/b'